MREQLNVVYREEPTSPGEPAWSSYSYPNSIYASGYTLEHVRDEFREAATFHYPEGAPRLTEHLERPASDGVFLRVAIDRHTLDRDYVRSSLDAALAKLSVHRACRPHRPSENSSPPRPSIRERTSVRS